MSFRALAPAKVNLYLHVVGKRPDGYHLLDSLFAFTEYGDVVEAFPPEELSLEIKGPYAAGLSCGEDNIVIKAALKLSEFCKVPAKARLVLEKNLPVASGIGGGSSDAAAALKVLQRLWNVDLSWDDLLSLALSLGADVPSCLRARPVHVSGIGEILEEISSVPRLFVLLVNPNKPVSTPQVFKERCGDFSRAMPLTAQELMPQNFIEALKARHNDLTDGAIRVEPAVKDVLEALEKYEDSVLSRMSGSGGTCFALFTDEGRLSAAKSDLEKSHPFWWVKETRFL